MNKYSKIITLFLFAFFFSSVLSACQKKAPEDVLTRAKQAMVQMKSGRITLHATVSGKSDKTSLEAQSDLKLAFKNEPNKPIALDLQADLNGQMNSPEKDLSLKTAFNLISESGKYYFKVDEFQTNEENLQFLVPLIQVYQGKWYHLSEDFIPSAISELQVSSADAVKKKQLDELFVGSALFDIQADHGTKKINNREAYKLNLSVNQQGFKDYFKQVAQINNSPLSESDLEQLVVPLSHVKAIEVYIDTETYYIYKALVDIENVTDDQNPSDVRLKLIFDGSDFDQNVNLAIPSSVQDFNPLALPESAVLTLPDEALEPLAPEQNNSQPEGVDLP